MGTVPIDVSRLTGEGKLTQFHVRLLLLTILLTMLDGYDITAISFAAPELAKAWGIADRSAFGPVFAASLVGMLFGAPALGWIGDRFGRKPAVIFSCIVFGAFTLAMMWASSLGQIMALRFITGIGLGGLLPNASALNAEYAPSRHRATMIILMYVGTAFGGAIPGPIAALLVPAYGWPILFFIGGALPIAGAIAAWIWLPESVKYLVLKGDRNEEVAKLVGSEGRTGAATATHDVGHGTMQKPADLDPNRIRQIARSPGLASLPRWKLSNGMELVAVKHGQAPVAQISVGIRGGNAFTRPYGLASYASVFTRWRS